jgi:hypothetical protein
LEIAMTFRKTLLLSTCSLALLAGCEAEHAQALSPGFGNSVKHNIAVQLVNPDPPEFTEPSGLDGRRAVEAYERYREDRVIRPSTSTVTRIGTQSQARPGGSGGPGTVTPQ